jgi:amidase
VNLASYLSTLTYNPRGIENLADLDNFTKTFPLEDYPDRNTATWDQALQQGFNNTSPQFWSYYQQNLFFGGEGGVLGALDRNNLDAVILPTSFSPGVPALVGSPVVTVPLGFYPPNTTVIKNSRGNLVATAPSIPYGFSFSSVIAQDCSDVELGYPLHFIHPLTTAQVWSQLSRSQI